MSINITAPINKTGYGVVSTNLSLAFEKIGHTPALWPIGGVDFDEENQEDLIKMINRRAQDWNPNSASLRIYHQFDLAQHIGKGKRLAYTFFELDRLKNNEVAHMNGQDVLFVSSKWARDIVINSKGIDKNLKVKVAHPGVNHDIFNGYWRLEQIHSPSKTLVDNPTVFLNIGKWEVRKGHEELCIAFNNAFEPTDNVLLVMNCYNPCLRTKEDCDKYNDEWTKMYKSSKMGSKIRILPNRLETHRDVRDLMEQADCGVFPSKAEGWNLELAEMMAIGKEVIATNYSAHTEFINHENCLLINTNETEPAYDGIWFDGKSGEWAKFGDIQMDMLVDHMRFIHKCKQEEGYVFNEPALNTMKSFTWENTASQIIQGF